MSKTIASITTSVDGYVTGPGDGPGCGLGVGGERLHYWVFGGPWTYDGARDAGEMSGEDRAHYEELAATVGSGICGRGMYDAAGAWGGTNPFPGTLFVLTHRREDPPDPSSGFRFVGDLDEALQLARTEADGRDVSITGGADLIRQTLAAGLVDELTISTVPVVLGAGKRLFEGFTHDLDLELLGVRHSPYAAHARYAVVRRNH
jgi:dihydrofolate reductase